MVKFVPFLVVLASFPTIALTQEASVTYTLSMPQPWTHLFEVEMTCANLPREKQFVDVRLPVWRTGRYLILDFAGGVEQFSADDRHARPLQWSKLDKTTWRIQTQGADTVLIRYEVYANEFGLRTRGLNDEHGFVDGTSVFMYIQEYRFHPVRLTIIPYGSWHVTTGLDSLAGKRFTFEAPSYDYLVDCPIEIGKQIDYTMEIEGKPHVISLYGTANCNFDSLGQDVARIVKMNRDFWGDLPYKRFVFLIHATPEGGGGTEHINSVVLDYRSTYAKHPEPCHGLVGLLSHEFFHTWNVKRLRPKGMDPYDWTRENYYRELWLAEGATSYLHGLLLMRNGYSTAKQYLDGIDSTVRYDRERPGNRAQTPTESSFDAWIKYFRRTQEAYNFETDYYSRGANVCLLLDLELRHRSENKHSFGDVLRALYKKFPLGSGGYTVEDVERVAGELAGSQMHDFFDRYIRGAEPLEWERVLGYAGLRLMPVDSLRKPWVGIEATDKGGRAIVRTVVAGSPGYDAGLNVDDEIVALDGYRARAADLQRRIQEAHAGDRITFVVLRDDKLREFTATVKIQEVPPYHIEKVSAPTPLQKAIYESWLRHPRQ